MEAISGTNLDGYGEKWANYVAKIEDLAALEARGQQKLRKQKANHTPRSKQLGTMVHIILLMYSTLLHFTCGCVHCNSDAFVLVHIFQDSLTGALNDVFCFEVLSILLEHGKEPANSKLLYKILASLQLQPPSH